jgi:hypothetical protein
VLLAEVDELVTVVVVVVVAAVDEGISLKCLINKTMFNEILT